MPLGWVMAGTALVGALSGANAASDAAGAQVQASQLASDTQLQMFNKLQGNLQPYMDAGTTNLGELSALMADPNSKLNAPFTLQQYQQSPGYKFQLQQGIDAIQNSAAAKGLTGNTLKSLASFGQGLANQDWQQAYQNYTNNQNTLYNRLTGMVNTGANAAAGIAGIGSNTANKISENQIGAGNAQAAGAVGGAQAISNGINGGVSNWLMSNYLQNVAQANGGLNNFDYGSIGNYTPADYSLSP